MKVSDRREEEVAEEYCALQCISRCQLKRLVCTLRIFLKAQEVFCGSSLPGKITSSIN